MNVKKIKEWLNKLPDEEYAKVYIETEEEDLIDPNMGYALRDEIFNWQDRLDNIEYSDEGLAELYLLVEDILDTLELRLKLNPALMEKLNSIDKEDFVKFDMPQKSFFDYVNDYCAAEKISDVVQTCSLLIYYVQGRIKNVQCEIYDGQLWIKPINNASCSTSIISEALEIKSSNIDDHMKDERVWSIHLYRR